MQRWASQRLKLIKIVILLVYYVTPVCLQFALELCMRPISILIISYLLSFIFAFEENNIFYSFSIFFLQIAYAFNVLQ